MKPIHHRTTNAVLGAPPGWTREECQPLYITRVQYAPSGRDGVISYWQPDAEERARIARGEPVRINFIGVTTHPPVAVEVDGDGWPA